MLYVFSSHMKFSLKQLTNLYAFYSTLQNAAHQEREASLQYSPNSEVPAVRTAIRLQTKESQEAHCTDLGNDPQGNFFFLLLLLHAYVLYEHTQR